MTTLDLTAVRRTVQRVPLDADARFDAALPTWARAGSPRWWTPVRVARVAVELLVRGRPRGRYLDIGSGVGKFCLVGALASEANFHGVEQDSRLHHVALATARALAMQERCTFELANALEVDWQGFDGLYLFNPFETEWGGRSRVLSMARRCAERLRDLPGGTRVVTYNGFGGVMPPAFALVEHQVLDGATR